MQLGYVFRDSHGRPAAVTLQYGNPDGLGWTVVLALADPNAPVMSMTNGIECYVQQAISALRVRLLDVIPRNIRWVEIDSEGEYSVVTFDWDGEIPLDPKWAPTTREEVSHWLG
jgi:hypothetical protein